MRVGNKSLAERLFQTAGRSSLPLFEADGTRIKINPLADWASSDLLAYADEQLKSINSLKIYGQAAKLGAIISFTMEGAHPHDIATVIDRQGVAVRAGTHCTMPLLERFGLTASCRASFAMYSTRSEVDRLVEALQSAQRLFM